MFLNLDGFLAEGTISNIFIVKNGILKTPSLDCGILYGVTRSSIMEVTKKAGIKVAETKIKSSEVYNADEVFLSSTTMEAMPVVKVDSKTIGAGKPGLITQIVHEKFRDLVECELKIKLPQI